MKCPKCGSDRVENDFSDPTCDEFATCKSCGCLFTHWQQSEIERLKQLSEIDLKNKINDAEIIATGITTIEWLQKKLKIAVAFINEMSEDKNYIPGKGYQSSIIAIKANEALQKIKEVDDV